MFVQRFFYLVFLFCFLFPVGLEAKINKKIMFIVHTETINGKGVLQFYRLFKKHGHQLKIVAMPLLIQNNEILYDLDLKYFDKFDQEDVVYPCGKQKPYVACTDVLDWGADIVFIQNPYNCYKGSILDPVYTLENLKKKCSKIAYVVYGPHLFHQSTCNDTHLPKLVDYVFVDSESTKSLFVENLTFNPQNVVVSGYQNYKNVRDLKETYKKRVLPKYKETILWMPRWTLHFRDRDKHEGGSTFLSYERFFYNYAKSHPEKFFIFRPHVYLFSYASKAKFLSDNEVKEIKTKFSSLPNVRFSDHLTEALEHDVLDADIVISEGSSALGEVVVADKPIIYTSNGWDNEFESNNLAKKFKEFIFFAHDPLELESHIDYIAGSQYRPYKINEDVKEDGSSSAWQKFKKDLDPVVDPARKILDFVKKI